MADAQKCEEGPEITYYDRLWKNMRLLLRARFTEYRLSNYTLEGGDSRCLQNFGTHPPD